MLRYDEAMRKTLVILITVALLGIVAAYELPATQQASRSVPNSTTQTETNSAQTTTAPTSTASYKDGTYTGITATNFYDSIQVQVVVAGGKITSVTTPVLQGESRHSDMINSQAVPLLTEQTLSVQSAGIDGVSGASYTSQSYIESLQSAIDQAKA